jgi:hypothetical protein
MLLALLLVLTPAHAKDLRSRFGVGFNQQFGTVSSLSARIGLPAAKPITNIQLEADIGLDLSAANTGFFAGGRLLYGVVAEDNLNLYLAAGAGYASDATGGVVRLEPAAGAEFFFFGLENLGFSVEWGVHADLGSTWSVKTIGTAPSVGVHYYF